MADISKDMAKDVDKPVVLSIIMDITEAVFLTKGTGEDIVRT